LTGAATSLDGRAQRRSPAVLSRFGRGLRPYGLILPKLAFFGVFLVFPIGWAIVLSFESGSILGSMSYVGLSNYQRLWSDSLFRICVENTLLYAVIVIPLVIGGGLVLAALLNRPIRFRSFFRVSLILPTVTPTVAAVIIWIYLLEGQGGIFNEVLGFFGLAPVLWLGSPHLVIPMIAMIECWRGIGFYTIVFLAGMQSIPRELYQAAAIDGITGVRAFWRITIPLLRPVILFATVVATIFNLQIFDSPYVLTQGGPGFSSTTLVMYIYDEAFSYDDMGYAAAISLMLMLMILLLAVIQLTFFRKDVEF
jgi:ABC-type sugar transport system permease subunit